METSESEYPVPSEKHLNYEDSWRPEDKAIESAERELASKHPDLLKETNDSQKVEPAFKDKDA
jgi:hypothetical protein